MWVLYTTKILRLSPRKLVFNLTNIFCPPIFSNCNNIMKEIYFYVIELDFLLIYIGKKLKKMGKEKRRARKSSSLVCLDGLGDFDSWQVNNNLTSHGYLTHVITCTNASDLRRFWCQKVDISSLECLQIVMWKGHI